MKKVRCASHGESAYVLLCQHLVAKRAGLGYLHVNAQPDSPGQAWCEACDRVLETERGWSDRADAAAGWKLVCQKCARNIRRRHRSLGRIIGTDG